MQWPRTPVERQHTFRPLFCPWPDCREHRRSAERPFPHSRHGFYTNRRRRIPRFRCSSCRRTFSQQTFALSYYLKRPELLVPVAAQLQAGSAHRQIARTLGCAPSTVTRLSARLGRHALLLHVRVLERLRGRLVEPVVLDHAELFEFSQDLPFGVATAVGAASWFCYTIDPAPHRRTGRRSPNQQERLDRRPPRAQRGGYRGSVSRVLQRLLGLTAPGRTLELRSDEHPAYVAATARLRRPIVHRRFANPQRGPKGSPRSAAALARDRALFPVDALHQLLRHTCAHHRRETIAFGRRLNALMERLYLTTIWRNFLKGLSEKKPDPATPAMRLGLADEPWNWYRVLARRLFPGRVRLSAVETTLYRRDWVTPVLPTNRRHRARHAF